MPYVFNPFTGSLDNAPATNKGDSAYTTVKANSATTWNYQGTDLKNLSSSWVGGNAAYTNLVANSAAYLSAVDLSFLSVSANWNSTYTTVQNNSATNWNYQGSDLKALSANWESTYSTVLANSATWTNALTGVAQTVIAQIVNADSVTMNRGDVVYTFGATGSVMSVKLASNTGEATSSKTFGVINGTILPNQIGFATFLGQVDKLNLGAYNEGDQLYLGSTAGTFTNVKPIAPNHLVYVGTVERANNGNGIIYVRTQNGYEIEELHNVQIVSVSAGQILRRNDTNNLWVNTNDGAKWDSTYSTVTSNSGNWNNVYSTVNSNSATTWNYQGSDLKSLSANWQSTYTTYNSNSGIYVKTVSTNTAGTSAISNIVAVSAIPVVQTVGTLYILM
jgi:hypothetical protein